MSNSTSTTQWIYMIYDNGQKESSNIDLFSPFNTHYQIVLTCNNIGSNKIGTIYRNSKQMGQTAQASYLGWDTGVLFFGNTGSTKFKLDYCYYYNRVLSPSEIQSLYIEPYQFIQEPSIWMKFKQAVAGGWVRGGEVKNVMVG